MPLSPPEKESIQKVIAGTLRAKFRNYTPTQQSAMPFHTRLLGKDRMALFSFIQSLNTTFGTVIYEPVAVELAKRKFQTAKKGEQLGHKITKEAQDAIRKIMNELGEASRDACQKSEMEEIRKVCRQGNTEHVTLRQADIYLVDENGWHYPIDIKTAKPNIDGYEKYKETLLKWTAVILYKDPHANVGAMLGIPYNPNHPKPYKHWTVRGMVEKDTQLKVGDSFWDFLAGEPVYDDLLTCFEVVGVAMRQEIDNYFAQFNTHQ